MEYTPLSTPSGEHGKDKKDDKKKPSTIRVPLYASEVHTDHGEPKAEESKKTIAEDLARIFSAEKESKATDEVSSDDVTKIEHKEPTAESPASDEAAVEDLPVITQEQLAPYEAPSRPAPTFAAYETPKDASSESTSESAGDPAGSASETSKPPEEEPNEPATDARGITPPPPPRPPVGPRSAEAPQPEPEPEPRSVPDLPAAAIARRFYQEQQHIYGEPEPSVPTPTSYARERVTPADLNEVRRQAQTDTLVVGGLAYVAARHHTNKVMRKHERAEDKQLHMRDERIAQLEAQQDQYRRRQLEQQYRQQAAGIQPERPVASTPNVAPPASIPRVEQTKTQQPEQPAEQIKTTPTVEQRPPQKRPDEESIVPAGHHLERSEWHTIEIDDKTGKLVERQYGEAMRQERAPEQMLAGHAQSGASQQDQDAGGSTAGMIGIGGSAVDPRHYQAQPQPAQQRAQSSTGEQILANVKSPWFWLVIIFLLLVFFSISFL
ncbi:MAG TPA: hypothetical protein VHT70_00960 [Candidatus Saccharimonadales bacterium]|nr:hypothetical protein [Candidatus Saccharimonadales bacterium]